MSWYFWPAAIGGGLALSLVWVVVLVIVLFDLIKANRQPEWKMVWLLLIVMLPIVGVVLYYFFGRDRVPASMRHWKDFHGIQRRLSKNSQKGGQN